MTKIFTASFLVLAMFCSAARAADNPNIVFILVDDMGYGDPGCFNPDSKIATPNIDALAHEGMKFTDAHAPGALCHMSRYGLLTGRFPFRTNVNLWRKQPLIDADQVTIASLLKSQGYSTAMVGKWHLGFKENGYENPLPGGPADRGFDSYFGIRASTDIPPYFYIRGNEAVSPPTDTIEDNFSEGWSKIQGAFWRKGGIAPDLKLKDVLPRFTDEAIGVIQNHAKSGTEKPLMLYLAYPAPHTPWLPSKKFQGKSKVSMYGDFVMMVDSMIGKVVLALDEAGMKDDTLLIFSADNGPVWYDADVKKYDHSSVGVLRGMKADAWEGGHRMPFIVRWPGKVKAGSVSKQTICFTDMLATFAAVTGTELPEGAGPDSFNVLPAMLGTQSEDEPLRGPLVIAAGGGIMSIRSGPWKLITGLGSGGFTKPNKIKPTKGGPIGQLYNLENDLSETTNLYLKHPEIVKRLLAELEQVTGAEMSRGL
ncbi:MAG: arylsulfatase [Blastopirellula sp.]|nr:MAG: arylsulfatase [Blastopirellula sp.]